MTSPENRAIPVEHLDLVGCSDAYTPSTGPVHEVPPLFRGIRHANPI